MRQQTLKSMSTAFPSNEKFKIPGNDFLKSNSQVWLLPF